MPPGTSPRELPIDLTSGEYVAPRGKREITWLVALNDDWVHVSAWPGAEVERNQAMSGTVWENRTRLRVAPGTRLMRIESRPIAYKQRDALDYLSRGGGENRQIVRQEFQVGGRGELVRQG